MKIIEHFKDGSIEACAHRGDDWRVAIAHTMTCLGMGASVSDYQTMTRSFATEQPVWHGGYLLTGHES